MALQNIGYVYLPEIFKYFSTPFNPSLLDATTDRHAFIFEVPPGDTGKVLNEIMFRTTTVTTSQSLDCRIETVDAATGLPTGTLYGGSAAATNTGAFASNTAYLFSFGTGATVTAGDKIAIVIQYTSTAGTLNIAMYAPPAESTFPYIAQNLTGAYAKSINNVAVGHLKYSDGTFARSHICPIISHAAVSFNSGSTPNERGAIWIPRFKCRIAGVRGNFNIAADSTINLYEGVASPVLKATITIDKDIVGESGIGRLYRQLMFPTPFEPTVGTKYFVALTPGTTTNVSTTEIDVYSAGSLAHLELGADYYHGTRSGGAVTETTTKRAYISFIIDQLDDGAGGGGETIKGNPTSILGGYLCG